MAVQKVTAEYGRECLNWPIFSRSLAKNEYFWIYSSYCSKEGEFILYADDTNIFVEGNTMEEAFEKANRVIQKVHGYMQSNLLHINLSKCNFM